MLINYEEQNENFLHYLHNFIVNLYFILITRFIFKSDLNESDCKCEEILRTF